VISGIVLLALLVGIGDVFATDRDSAAASQCTAMYVHRITMTKSSIPGGSRVTLSVWIRDENNHPVAHAAVSGVLDRPGAWAKLGAHRTQYDGRATWTINAKRGGLWSLCVLSVFRPGYIYSPFSNPDSCELAWYP
jgi:hypothetical protein